MMGELLQQNPNFNMELLMAMPQQQRDQVLSMFTEKELQILWYDWSFMARRKQFPPPGEWRVLLLLAGRAFGKTRALTEWARMKANLMPGSVGAIVAPTAADCRDVLIEGDSGILNISPPWDKPIYSPTKRKIAWKNGSYALMFSADEPNRLRGPQHHWAILDEIASFRYPQAIDMLQMGLRLGKQPQAVMATTPRPLSHIRALAAAAREGNNLGMVRMVNGTSYENRQNLDKSFFDFMIKRYQNTNLGRQELMAELLEDAKGALWKSELFDRPLFRVEQPPTSLIRIVVGVDPGAKSAQEITEMLDNNEFGETGIIVVGLSRNGHVYVLDDYSISAHPTVWATRVKIAYNHYKADRVIAERNNGGDMVESTIHTVQPSIAYQDVVATRGKAVRAEPVAALYEQGRVHHVGVLPELETQMTQWVPADPKSKSPDRVDALVWCIHYLILDEEEAVFMRQAYVRD